MRHLRVGFSTAQQVEPLGCEKIRLSHSRIFVGGGGVEKFGAGFLNFFEEIVFWEGV